MSLQIQTHAADLSQSSGAERPYPLSMETINLVEQVLADALSALKQQAASAERRDAASLEYESWFARSH